MKLTWRGIALLLVVGAAFVLARAHGSRSLGVIVLSGMVALGAASWQVSSATAPALTRESPREGTIGERRAVNLTVESTDAGQLGVRDRLPAGIRTAASTGEVGSDTDSAARWAGDTDVSEQRSSHGWVHHARRFASRLVRADGSRTDASEPERGERATIWTVPGATAAYDVRLHARGEWTLGPAEVVVRDVFGLVERAYQLDDTDAVLVFPRAFRLTPAAFRQLLATVDATGGGDERTEFDGLREYDDGDPLRDIHWRISAKRDELIIAEYAEGNADTRATIAATATPQSADVMAEAAASFAVSLLDAGVPIELRLPGGTATADPGEQRAVLARLARVSVGEGASSDPGGSAAGAAGDTADVRVEATTDGVSVRLGERRSRFETLVVDPSRRPHPTESDDRTWFADTQTVTARRRNADDDSVDTRTTP